MSLDSNIHPYPTLFGCKPGADGRAVVLGVPYDRGTDSFRAGCSGAPAALRTLSENLSIRETGLHDLSKRRCVIDADAVSDLGNIRFYPHQRDEDYLQIVTQGVAAICGAKKKPLLLGGDHLVTLYAMRGIAATRRPVQVVQLDAHHDYAEISPGEKPTHATFVAYLAQEKIAKRILQVGVRGLSWGAPAAIETVETVTPEGLVSALEANVDVYVTVDTDAFDPSIAPGVGYPEPEGLTLNALRSALAGIRSAGCNIVGADWTEYNPQYDSSHHLTGRTALRGIALLLENMLHD